MHGDTTRAALGFVGVGKMGGPMANRLLDAHHALVVCDIRDEAAAPLIARGAAKARSSREVADAADIVFFSLPEPEDVRGEAIGEQGVIAGDRAKILVDLSTTGRPTTLEIAQLLSGKGITLIDAPVSGGVAGASRGSLAVMASGEASALGRVSPLLRIFGRLFVIGDQPGMGQVMKLANNILSAASLAIACEAIAMGVKAGLDPALMIDVINAGTGRNSATETKFPQSILPRRFAYGFTTGLMHKDVRLCMEQARSLDAAMPVGEAVNAIWAAAERELGPDSDYTEIMLYLERLSGIHAAPEKLT